MVSLDRVPGRDPDRGLPRGILRRPNLLTRFIDINIRNLAGVPSVVYGLMGLAIFVALFASLGVGTGKNILSGGLTLAVLVLPLVIITAAEAIRPCPRPCARAGTASARRAGRSSASSCCRRRARAS